MVTPENIKFGAKNASFCDNKGRKQTVMSATLTALALRTRLKESLFRELVDGLWVADGMEYNPALALEPFVVFPKLLPHFGSTERDTKTFAALISSTLEREKFTNGKLRT